MADHMFNDGDFIERVLHHVVRDPITLAKAREIGVRKEDFSAAGDFALKIYEVFASIALAQEKPITDPQVFLMVLRDRIQRGEISDSQIDDASNLFQAYYNSSSFDSDFTCTHLKSFIRFRREERAKIEAGTDNQKLLSSLKVIEQELSRNENLFAKPTTVNPFENLQLKENFDLIPTGFCRLNDCLGGGLGRGEYGQIIGYSGGGKTALGMNLCSGAALGGVNSTFLSLEEAGPDMSNRFYSKFFRIPYTQLHTGRYNMQLEQAFRDPANFTRSEALRRHLRIEVLKEVSPLSANSLYEVLLRNYEQTGFIPDMVLLDQLQFMIPNDNSPAVARMQGWEKEKLIAKDCDQLSHRKIGNRLFALWVLHQAKGKNKKFFTTDEIDGCKAIIQSADTVLGIGRESPQATEFFVFSMKNRHSKNFELPFFGNLEFMELSENVSGVVNPDSGMNVPPPVANRTAAPNARPPESLSTGNGVNPMQGLPNPVLPTPVLPTQ